MTPFRTLLGIPRPTSESLPPAETTAPEGAVEMTESPPPFTLLRRHTDRHLLGGTSAPLALDCCASCKFFLADPIAPAAVRLGNADRQQHGSDRPGNCRRHPVSVRKHDKEWCGEFHRQPAR